jgi:hypothetical protein
MSLRFGLFFRNVPRQLIKGNVTIAMIVECICWASPDDGGRVIR